MLLTQRGGYSGSVLCRPFARPPHPGPPPQWGEGNYLCGRERCAGWMSGSQGLGGSGNDFGESDGPGGGGVARDLRHTTASFQCELKVRFSCGFFLCCWLLLALGLASIGGGARRNSGPMSFLELAYLILGGYVARIPSGMSRGGATSGGIPRCITSSRITSAQIGSTHTTLINHHAARTARLRRPRSRRTGIPTRTYANMCTGLGCGSAAWSRADGLVGVESVGWIGWIGGVVATERIGRGGRLTA